MMLVPEMEVKQNLIPLHRSFNRWCNFKEMLSLNSHDALAEFLLNAYEICTCREADEQNAIHKESAFKNDFTKSSCHLDALISAEVVNDECDKSCSSDIDDDSTTVIAAENEHQNAEINVSEDEFVKDINQLYHKSQSKSELTELPSSNLCCQCSKKFLSKDALVRHLKIHDKVLVQAELSVEHELTNLKTRDKEKENDDILDHEISDSNCKENASSHDSDDALFNKKRKIKLQDHEINQENERGNKNLPHNANNLAFRKKRRKFDSEDVHKCQYCSKEFKNSLRLNIHVRIHTGERPYVCSVCEKTFIDAKALQVHGRIHSGTKPYACPSCERTFTQNSNLKRHIAAKHTKSREYLCQFCDAKFGRLEHLQVHERGHNGEKPFKCSFCSQTFTTKQHKQRHEVQHTGNKEFLCPYCDKAFVRRDRLLKHKQKHSNEHDIVKQMKAANASGRKGFKNLKQIELRVGAASMAGVNVKTEKNSPSRDHGNVENAYMEQQLPVVTPPTSSSMSQMIVQTQNESSKSTPLIGINKKIAELENSSKSVNSNVLEQIFSMSTADVSSDKGFKRKMVLGKSQDGEHVEIIEVNYPSASQTVSEQNESISHVSFSSTVPQSELQTTLSVPNENKILDNSLVGQNIELECESLREPTEGILHCQYDGNTCIITSSSLEMYQSYNAESSDQNRTVLQETYQEIEPVNLYSTDSIYLNQESGMVKSELCDGKEKIISHDYSETDSAKNPLNSFTAENVSLGNSEQITLTGNGETTLSHADFFSLQV